MQFVLLLHIIIGKVISFPSLSIKIRKTENAKKRVQDLIDKLSEKEN